MKKYLFNNFLKYEINANTFQCGLLQNKTNKYLHFTLLQTITNIKLQLVAKGGNIKCLKYMYKNRFTNNYFKYIKNIW